MLRQQNEWQLTLVLFDKRPIFNYNVHRMLVRLERYLREAREYVCSTLLGLHGN